MGHDPHFGFVVAAYVLALAIVAAMVVTIITDYLSLKRALLSLAAQEKDQALDAPRNPDPES
jgi:heme exporter protein CcmD